MTSEHAVTTGLATFMPRARLLRLIGAELISDEVVAITELVKNAHDADATFISLQFTNVTDEGGEIVIRDDGFGMDQNTLLTRWMQPAGSSKGREGTRYTPKGRRVLGEKGVGRFAADKLGAKLELVSRRPAEPTEVHAVFDWDEFDADELMLSDVTSRWEVRPADWLDSHGTMLRISRLRTRWSERMFRRLCTRLARLVSPFQAQTGFRILIESDEFPSYSGEVNSGYLKDAPYRVEAEFDGNGSISVRVNGGKSVRHNVGSEEALRCGPVRVRFFAFDLETESLARVGPRAEVRAWLREWSGISVYRDGFRIWPYGEPHDDWLRLDQRRVNNPVVRLSNNQIVGFVEVSSDRNPELRDQTNREGLIHNAALADLQGFVLQVLQLLEAERQATRHPQAKKAAKNVASRASREAAGLPDQLDALAAKATGTLGEELRRAAEKARNAAINETATRKRMLLGYTDLAATGQAASLVGQSVAACLETVKAACIELKDSFKKADVGDVIKAHKAFIELEVSSSIAIEHLRSVTSAGNASKRRRAVDLVTELKRVALLSEPLLREHDAEMFVQSTKELVIRTEIRPELLGAVFGALIMNALDWRRHKTSLRITAAVRTEGENVAIIFSDNGKGVTAGLADNIFEPMVSGRPDGSGMGLTIARSVIEQHGGSITLLSDKRRPGTNFQILLPRKKSRATR